MRLNKCYIHLALSSIFAFFCTTTVYGQEKTLDSILMDSISACTITSTNTVLKTNDCVLFEYFKNFLHSRTLTHESFDQEVTHVFGKDAFGKKAINYYEQLKFKADSTLNLLECVNPRLLSHSFIVKYLPQAKMSDSLRTLMYVHAEINDLKRKISYCNLRINSIFEKQSTYAPSFVKHNGKMMPLFQQPINSLVEKGGFVTVSVDQNEDGNYLITGYQKNESKKGFIAKIDLGKVKWIKYLPNFNQQQLIGTYVNFDGKNGLAIAQESNGLNNSKKFILEFSALGDFNAPILLSTPPLQSEKTIYLSKNSKNEYIHILQSSHAQDAINKKYLTFAMMDTKGKSISSYSKSMKVETVDILQMDQNLYFVCNAAKEEKDYFHRITNQDEDLHPTLMIFNSKRGDLEVVNIPVKGSIRSASINKNQKIVLSGTQKGLSKYQTDELFSLIIDHKGEVEYQF